MRSRQFGIYLTGPKQDAILRGDLSNTVVHPYFVHTMTPLGMYFCAGLKHSPALMQLRAKYAQRAYEDIAELVTGGDTELLVQAFSSMATMSLHAKYFENTRHNLKKACIALNAAKLRFIPETGRPPRLTEDLRERLVMLSQVIYLESYMFLAVDGIEPNMTTRIANEFRAELQVRVRFLTTAAWADNEGTGNIPALVRDLSVDYADTGNLVDQGCGIVHDTVFSWWWVISPLVGSG